MTIKQLRKDQAKARREKKLAKGRARKARKQSQVQRRKVKRAIKAAPRNRLTKWSHRIRAGGKCVVCGVGVVHKMVNGKPKIGKRGSPIVIQLQAHHLLPKEKYPQFKFKTINGVCLCPNHHKYGERSAHRNPIWFALWLQKHLPIQYQWCVNMLGVI